MYTYPYVYNMHNYTGQNAVYSYTWMTRWTKFSAHQPLPTILMCHM